ncbi:DEAD/DEAH box helicase [Chloroflexus sp.]|uniref:DEAD/DEAH box helicase n=1 Tax=Chloroflexus sp. TaxID=1904827 RepID=UPI00298EE63D|nr:DEAD/DEAH box helicase [Chloroflexus sp.]MDW8403000.1 DEAD/DEAH box helicase [Chloroflexus sp.]
MKAISEPERLVKGPLLEASPSFEHGRTINQLINAGILHPRFSLLCSDALPINRPLYRHQDRAIEHVVRRDRNVIVATGTGSGKTESFLLPILDALLREQAAGTLEEPGVRALLLYPMNALANDQLKRLRRVLKSFPAITFGRYTGETVETPHQARERFYEQFPGEQLISNELLSRKELRERPPHILLTNYAMLEYLLLRPEDCEFFDGPTGNRWRFIVLDEAHIYDGASGIEIAMLLRRLKDRVVQSQKGRIRCIATSATLGRGRPDFPVAVKFAERLFGETFEWDDDDPARQDVIEADRVPAAVLGPVWGKGSPEFYKKIRELLVEDKEQSDVSDLLQSLMQAVQNEIPAIILADAQRAFEKAVTGNQGTVGVREQIDRWLFAVLRGEERLRRLRDLLSEQPVLISKAASAVFPDSPQAQERVIDLIDLAVRARPESDALALLPARYHVFARALEGAFACLNQREHTDQLPRIFLSRHETCPECKKHVVELACCNRCGATFIVGRTVSNEFDNSETFPRLLQLSATHTGGKERPVYLLLNELPEHDDEDEAVVAGDDLDADDRHSMQRLCLNCGCLVANEHVNCACESQAITVSVAQVALNQFHEPKACPKCSTRNSGSLIYRFLTGQDAPVSVLATTLYQQLPPAREPYIQAFPGGGRKLLIFSDSRQDAAFFAPYLERTYSQVLQRRLILETLIDDPDGRQGALRLQDVVNPLRKKAEQANIFSQRQSQVDRRRIVTTWLMQELISLDRRLGLEGLGMLHFRLIQPDRWQPIAGFKNAPWNLTNEEIWDLTTLLLDTLRQQGATTFPSDVDPRDVAFAPRAKSVYIRGNGSNSKASILSWMPVRGRNRRYDLLDRLLQRIQPELDTNVRDQLVREALQGIWDDLTHPRSCWREHMVSRRLNREGIVYQLSHEFWELVPEPVMRPYRCTVCQTITYTSVRDLCPTTGCKGRLTPISSSSDQSETNHYRALYRSMRPIPLTAEEHTAQWTSEEASKIQTRFVNGEVNVLSCSTTFELGVDVGDLQTVLMRNVPPTTANYVQRAGRAGRRAETAAYVLTFAQRRSHDLTYYADPDHIVAGKVTPPRFSIANAKIARRHMQATLIAAFFRNMRDREGRLFHNVGDFFQPSDTPESGATLLKAFAAQRPEHVRAALHRIVPEEIHAEVGIESWEWLNDMFELLERVGTEVVNDLEMYLRLEKESAQQGDYKQSERYQYIRNTIRFRSLLDTMASRNLLPKYGFPTDVVELKTSHLAIAEAAKVELQRDLRMAIAEYAPGSHIVAAKRVWQGSGIYIQPNKSLPVHYYAVCLSCGHFHLHPSNVPAHCVVCGESLRGGRHQGRFIKPEFGFLAAGGQQSPGEQRPPRLYSSRVYFAEYAPKRDGEVQVEPEFKRVEAVSGIHVQVDQRYSRFGRMVLVNSGPADRGFAICNSCGYAEIAFSSPTRTQQNRGSRPMAHINPRTGHECNASTFIAHLGHDFLTDVIEIRFRGTVTETREELWRSLVYALLEGAAQGLGIRRDDLDGTLYRYPSGLAPALILYDNVPGGAGHVKYIEQELPIVIEAAYARVNRDCCGPETSCYECLRNYRNQPYHDNLCRGLARDFLAIVANQTKAK